MYEANGLKAIVDASYLRRYLRIDHTLEDDFLNELAVSATENLEHRLKRHVIARDPDDKDAVCSDISEVPAALRVYVGACAAFVYANRESDCEKSFKPTPYFERLIDPWRMWK